jgi:hypothetical protein
MDSVTPLPILPNPIPAPITAKPAPIALPITAKPFEPASCAKRSEVEVKATITTRLNNLTNFDIGKAPSRSNANQSDLHHY